MRIAVVTSSYPENDDDPSGHFVRAEVNELVRQGHTVTVICPGRRDVSPRGVAEQDMSGQNPTLVRLGATGLFGWPGALSKLRTNPLVLWQLWPFVRRARAMLRNHAYDRVIAHWLVPCGWPIALASRTQTEIVVHGSDARLVGVLPRFLRDALLSRLHARGHYLRFVAAHLKPFVTTPRTRAWINDSQIAASPLLLPTLPNKTDARRALGLDPSAFVALVVGRLVPGKRIDVALEKAPLPTSARVWVIGSGPCMADLCRRFPNVTFLGQLPRTQTLVWLKASDVLLNASLAEGAPSVVREARALDVEVWSAPCDVVTTWAADDSGISIRPEFC